MRYYKGDDPESPIGEGIIYLEVMEGYPVRQITVTDTQRLSSNRDFMMGHGQTDFDEVEEALPISKEEFDLVWSRHLEAHREEWERAKDRYPIGTPVEGVLKVFFPQGVIVELEQTVHGVAEYQACRDSTPPMNLYPGHEVTGVVKGYDEINQWIILNRPQVGEVVIDYTWRPE